MINLNQKLKNIPHQPGCYLFSNNRGKVIYIGKAKDLSQRLPWYFAVSNNHDVKTRDLVKQIVDVEFIVTDNEVEALLLESGLIRQHKPKYNIELKDSLRYAYLKFTNDDLPRLEVTRVIKPNDKVFGPYAVAGARTSALRLANQLFKLRVGRAKPRQIGELYHYRSSVVPFVQKMTLVDYNDNVKKAKLLLKGDNQELIKELTVEMQDYSKAQKYELAKLRRDQIKALEHIRIRQKVALQKRYNQDVINFIEVGDKIHIQLFNINKGVMAGRQEFKLVKLPGKTTPALMAEFIQQYYYGADIPQEVIVPIKLVDQALTEKYLTKLAAIKVVITVPKQGTKKKILDLVRKNIAVNISVGDASLLELQNKLSLPVLPRVIECFDISNLGPTNVVASMVQFRDGVPDKNNYRRFKIKSFVGQSDFDAMREVVGRRYYKITKDKSALPDLIMVDGGKPQLSAARRSLSLLGLQHVPLIALAKREEEVYTIGSQWPLRLSKKSDALKLLQRIRDEAHRFAINYQRSLRKIR